jgi:hypothetical protein
MADDMQAGGWAMRACAAILAILLTGCATVDSNPCLTASTTAWTQGAHGMAWYYIDGDADFYHAICYRIVDGHTRYYCPQTHRSVRLNARERACVTHIGDRP